MTQPNPLYVRIIEVLRSIPEGRVASYGQVAACSGHPRHARLVSRILHSSSKKYNLPWHRVVGSGGVIRLPKGGGFEQQIVLLKAEGIAVSDNGIVDMKRYGLMGPES